jgi:hypothetical protein
MMMIHTHTARSPKRGQQHHLLSSIARCFDVWNPSSSKGDLANVFALVILLYDLLQHSYSYITKEKTNA